MPKRMIKVIHKINFQRKPNYAKLLSSVYKPWILDLVQIERINCRLTKCLENKEDFLQQKVSAYDILTS